MSQVNEPPLAGYRIAVTSAHRAEELCALLRRAGATVIAAPAIVMVALPDDVDLHRHTDDVIRNPPDVVIATTGIGFRGWIAAADGWGLAEELLAVLSAAQLISRGPKATGALRAAGLSEEWSAPSESFRELSERLLATGVAGKRVAVQLHGATEDWDSAPELLCALNDAGAEVIPIRVYRWVTTPPDGKLDQLLTEVVQRQVDAVTFTSAAAVMTILGRAGELGLADQLRFALRCDVHAMCVGPLTAEPLTRLGIPTSCPPRPRLGALARHIGEQLPRLRPRTVQAAGHLVEIRNSCVVVDGTVKQLAPAAMATLRELARRPGNVVDRHDLLRALPGNGSDTHAVETAVLRLRTALGDRNIVRTVVKRGYRLAIDEQIGAA